MSMDLEVWSTRPFDIPTELPQAHLWNEFDEEFSFDGGKWQVLVLTEPSEPSEMVSEALPGASQVAYVTLEPLGAGEAGYMFLEDVCRTLARNTMGVWVDPYGFPYRHDAGSFG